MASHRSVNRILVNILSDGALAAVAAPIARFLADPGGGLLHPIWFLAGGAITLLLSGLPLRLPQQYWRFSALGDLVGVACASVAGTALFCLGLWVTGYALPSPTFPAIQALTLMALLGSARVAYRLSHGRARGEAEAPWVLLVGADEAADQFMRAAARERGPGVRIAGLVSLARHQTGRRIRGRTILGGLDELEAVLERLRRAGRLPAALVLTDPGFAGPPLARLMAIADAAGIAVRRVPRPTALRDAERDGAGLRLDLRPVAIEDLLNRPQVPLDRDGMARLVGGRRVLVTGAGGTIGSELARQVAALQPAELVLLDNGEYALWQIDLELAEAAPALRRRAVIADVRDRGRLHEVFAQARPELVFHAAALKHVPMVEANPVEGLLTNACGTRHVADAARACGTAMMVLVSTDKAVNPTSLMGATKRLAELYCQALAIEAGRAAGPPSAACPSPAARQPVAADPSGREPAARLADDPPAVLDGLRCVTVRFGNVLGSTGSVVPLFRRQLERGGPLTVTHPDMQRYFMTVREAVGLVLQASVLAAGDPARPAGTPAAPGQPGMAGQGTTVQERGPAAGEGGIFVLDMGEPVRIVSLARQMIRLAGLRPDQDVAIRFTGLRPGEKLFEELFHGREPPVPTGQPGLLMAAPRTADRDAVRLCLERIEASCRNHRLDEALRLLAGMVPEYVAAGLSTPQDLAEATPDVPASQPQARGLPAAAASALAAPAPASTLPVAAPAAAPGGPTHAAPPRAQLSRATQP